MGSALLNRRGDTEILSAWMSRSAPPDQRRAERVVEAEVSQVIRAMPFLWLSVPTRTDGTSDRGLLERNLIGLLSTLVHSGDGASADWLGGHAVAPKVRASSLWNVNHVEESYDPLMLDVLERYVEETAVEAGSA